MFTSELNAEERAVILNKPRADIVHFPKHRPQDQEQAGQEPPRHTLIIPISNE